MQNKYEKMIKNNDLFNFNDIKEMTIILDNIYSFKDNILNIISILDDNDAKYNIKLAINKLLPKILLKLENIILNGVYNNIKVINNIDNKIQDKYSECCICFEEIKTIFAMVPCGHTSLCDECYNNNNKSCPICKVDILYFIKIYL